MWKPCLDILVRINGINVAAVVSRDGFVVDYSASSSIDAEGLAALAAMAAAYKQSQVVVNDVAFNQYGEYAEHIVFYVRHAARGESAVETAMDWPVVAILFQGDDIIVLVSHRRDAIFLLANEVWRVLDNLGLSH